MNPQQELKQFIYDLRRNCTRYPVEFTEQQIAETAKTKRTIPTAARKDPLNGSWAAQLETLKDKLK